MPSGYLTLELGFPGKPNCPNEYERLSTLYCANASRLRLQIANSAVFLQFGNGYAAPVWGAEEPFYPSVGSIPRTFDAVRVRNFTAGQAAQVFLTAYP